MYLHTISFQIFIHISVNNTFENPYMLIVKYLWIIMTKYFVMRNFRGTCSSVEMLKGYIVRGRLGTPELN